MGELPYMSVSIADAIADAEGLTNEQLGALERIRRVLWLKITAETTVPMLALDELQRVSRLGKRWGVAGPGVLARLTVADGFASCPVVNVLLARTRKRRAKRATEAPRKSSTVVPQKREIRLRNQSLDPDLVGPPDAQSQSKKQKQQTRDRHDALYRDGVALLMDRTGVTRLQAQKTVSAWLVMVRAPERLVEILAAARTENLIGQQLNLYVARRCEQVERECTKGLSLPLGPAVVRGRR